MSEADSIAALLDAAALTLRAAGIAEARREARLLLGFAAAIAPASQIAHPERRLDRTAIRRFHELAARRAAREPLSHILGRREFFSRAFGVSRDVLDPRPDSETLIEASLAALAGRQPPYRLLDLGTGSGCLLLTLLAELPAASGIGTDVSPVALDLARANATRLGLAEQAEWRQGDWADGVKESFDLVLSNPPYVARGDLAGLQPEVRLYEPPLALDGGADGLDAYRALAPAIPSLLAEDGILALEIGAGQADSVEGILEGAGLAIRSAHRDLGGHVRCLLFSKKEKKIQ